MRKFIVFAIITILNFYNISYAQNGPAAIEQVTPGSALLFVKSAKIDRFVKTLNFMIKTFPREDKRTEILKGRNDFKSKTGIDLLNSKSLKKNGIDISRPFGFAFFKKLTNEDRILIIIPILDEKKFPLDFVKISKKMKKEKPEKDLYPAITEYNGNKIYQMQKDMFFTAAAGYFFIAPTGELIKKSIDLSAGNGKNIASDPAFMKYKDKVEESFDLNLFVKSEFLAEKTKQMHDPNKPNRKKSKIEKASAALDSIEFISAGFGLAKKSIKVNVAANLKPQHPIIKTIIESLKSGISKRALFLKKLEGYTFISLNPDFFLNICRKKMPYCKNYSMYANTVNMELGIDLNEDFLPYFSGGINAFFDKFMGQGGQPSFAVFFPMNNAKATAKLWNKIRKHIKGKYKKEKKYGEQRIGRSKSFWYMDKTRKKKYFTYDKRGFYAGSNAKILKIALRSKEVMKSRGRSILLTKMKDDKFFLVYIKRKSFVGNLITMQAMSKPELKNSMSRMGDIYISGKKNGNFVSIEIDVGFRMK